MSDDSLFLLIEITVYDPAIAGTRTLYVCNRTNYVTKSSDSPVSTPYLNRLLSAGTLSIDLIAAWAKGLAAYGIGALTLANTDHALDPWAKYIFDGYAINLYFGTLNPSTGALTKVPLYSGVMEQPDFGLRTIGLVVRSQMYALDKPVVTETFAGTGGTNPPEGDATVQGQLKFRVVGDAENVSLIPVDATNLVYFAGGFAPIVLYPGVSDQGLPLIGDSGGGTHGEYPSLAALYAATIAPGHWAYAYGGAANDYAYVRLGSAPAGQLTSDLSGLGTGQLWDLVYQLVQKAGLPAASADAVTDCQYPLGGFVYPNNVAIEQGCLVKDSATYAETLAYLVASISGWVWFAPQAELKPLGVINDVWIVGTFPSDDTVTEATVVIPESDIIDLKKLGNPKNPGEGVPPYQVVCRYGKNETPMPSGLASTVTVTDRARLGGTDLARTATDLSVLTKYPLAQSVTVGGNLKYDGAFVTGGPGAQEVADGLLAGLGHAPDFYQLTVKLSPALLQYYTPPVPFAGLSSTYTYRWLPCIMPSFLGAGLGVQCSRFGFIPGGNGTICTVMNVALDLDKKEVTYVIWTTYRAG